MYKDRMFENENEYLSFLARTGIPSDAGHVYWVVQKSKAFYQDYIYNKQFVYSDGTIAVHTDSGDGKGIQNAINACKGGRNDYVFVGTGNYNLSAALTLAGKSSVHLVGLNGGGVEVGTLGAAALTQTGAFENVIMEAYCELTGLQIINKNGYSAVTIAAGKWRPNVHNNCFHMVAGSAINIIDATGALACSYGRICNNRFATWVGGDLTSAINVGTGTGVDICKNVITQYNGTMDYGIIQAGAQCIVKDNVVSDCGGGGVVTVAVQLYEYSSAISNRLSVPAGRGLAGGTAAKGFVDNMDGATGAGNGSASNLET